MKRIDTWVGIAVLVSVVGVGCIIFVEWGISLPSNALYWPKLFAVCIATGALGWLIGYIHCRMTLADKCERGECVFGHQRVYSDRRLGFSDEVLHMMNRPSSSYATKIDRL